MKNEFKAASHILVPKHTKLDDKARDSLLDKYKIRIVDLPVISISDPALSGMELKINDVIMIERKSETAGVSLFYRRVGK